jgi:membrane protein implicated in regulation of membrane protease activity
MNLSKTNWTLIATIVIAVGNAVVPFMSAQISGIVVTILSVIAFAFHISDVQTATAQAKAPQKSLPPQAQQ